MVEVEADVDQALVTALCEILGTIGDHDMNASRSALER